MKVKLTATCQAELTDALIALSKAYPGKAITAHVSFGSAIAYIYPSLSRIPVDNPDTRQMLSAYGALAFVDGKLRQPTAGWLRQQHLADLRNIDH